VKYNDKSWASLPTVHRELLHKLCNMFAELGRWPTYTELAKELGRTVSSVRNSFDVLRRRGIVCVQSYGRGLPPTIKVKGYHVALEKWSGKQC